MAQRRRSERIPRPGSPERDDAPRPRVAVVDRFALVAEVIAMTLERTSSCTPVVVAPPAMSSTNDVCAAVLRTRAPIAVLSLTRGGLTDVLTLVEELRARRVTVLVTGPELDEVSSWRYQEAGAASVRRDARVADVAEMLAAEISGHHQSRVLRPRVDVPRPRLEGARLGADAQAQRDLGRLAPAEARILRELMRGRAADDIARDHVVSIATVRTQISRVLAKLGVSSQLAAVAIARQAGWEPADESAVVGPGQPSSTDQQPRSRPATALISQLPRAAGTWTS